MDIETALRTFRSPNLANYPELAGYTRGQIYDCLLYTSPSPRDGLLSRMPSSA